MEHVTALPPELEQLRQEIRTQQLAKRFQALLDQQLKASQQREILSNLANLFKDSLESFLEMLTVFTSTNAVSEFRAGVERAWESFHMHICAMIRTDLKLGATEDSLKHRIEVIAAILNKIYETGHNPNTEDALLSNNEDAAVWETSDDNESSPPLLSQYLKVAATVTSTEERVSATRNDLSHVKDRCATFEEQDRPIPAADVETIHECETHIDKLEQDLQQARTEREHLMEECARNGIDVERGRWREIRKERKTQEKASDNHDGRFHQWFTDVEPDATLQRSLESKGGSLYQYDIDHLIPQSAPDPSATSDLSFGNPDTSPSDAGQAPKEASTALHVANSNLRGHLLEQSSVQPSATSVATAGYQKESTVVWFYHPQFHLHYFYDDQSDQFVYENGAVTRRPASTSREDLLAAKRAVLAGDPAVLNMTPQAPIAYGSGQNMMSLPVASPYTRGYGTLPRSNGDAVTPAAFDTQLCGRQMLNHEFGHGQPGETSLLVAPTSDMRSMSLDEMSTRREHLPMGALGHQMAPTTMMQKSAALREVSKSTPSAPEAMHDPEPGLYSSFKKKVKTRRFFVVGKVFLTLWNEPAGDVGSNYTAVTSDLSIGPFGERIRSKIRRFVVVREGEQSCSALPILTYSHQGVGKAGVKKAEHAIIYTGRDVPQPHRNERARRGEDPMLLPIRVDPDDLAEKLDPLSRIHFGKVYNIEHNVKVRSFGKVNSASMTSLLYQFRDVWMKTFDGPNLESHIRSSRGMPKETVEASAALQPADEQNSSQK